MRTFDDLVRAGKVHHVGFSDVPAWYASRGQTIAEIRGAEPFCALQLEYSLVERSIEDEYVPLGIAHGMGIVVWSPLGSGLLSGKYRPSRGDARSQRDANDGRLRIMSGAANPAFAKLTQRNWHIVATLEEAAGAVGRSMAQVAINWVAQRPGVASVLVGATKRAQLDDNLAALDFTLPAEIVARLDDASKTEPRFPYYFFEPDMQAMLAGDAPLGDKPSGYAPPLLMRGKAAGTTA